MITSSWGQRLRFSARTGRAHSRGVIALIPSLSQTEARRHCERYVAPYFTAGGRRDPSVAAQALSSAAGELGVSTVPDPADIYRTEPAQGPAA